MRHYCAINGGRLVGRGARNENQPNSPSRDPTLSKRGLRPFLDNPDNLTRMYTLWRDSCLVRCQGRSVQGLVNRAYLNNGRNAFLLRYVVSLFYFFFLDELKLLYYVHILKFIEQLNVWREVGTCKNTRYFAYIYSICNLKLFRERYLRTNDRSRIYKGWNGEEKRRDKCANGLEESGVWK